MIFKQLAMAAILFFKMRLKHASMHVRNVFYQPQVLDKYQTRLAKQSHCLKLTSLEVNLDCVIPMSERALFFVTPQFPFPFAGASK